MRRNTVMVCVLAAGLLSQPAAAQLSPPSPARSPVNATAETTGCLACHAGIEGINDLMDRRWRAHTNCTACHKGEAAGKTAAAAHAGLIPKPGDLRVVKDTCGTCHSATGMGAGLTTGPAHDVVDRVLRSSMALATGEIAAVRYLWGEQSSATARFGVRSASALNGADGDGTLAGVAELPPATNSVADHLLRTRCLQCHLWTEPVAGVPPYRGAGCAACHVAYAANGRSRSGDPTISKVEVGHPRVHRIVRAVADAQCLTCHRDEGLGIGWNFAGWLTRAPGEAPTPTPASAVPVPPDVHAAAGMACIDCHDTWDVHGDGQIHSRGRSAVGIRCATCHGTPSQAPTFRTTRGHALTNVELRGDDAWLTGKVSGRVHRVPRLDVPGSQGTPPAHRIPGHLDATGSKASLTCAACHAGESRQHFMRQYVLDERQAVPRDWVLGVGAGVEHPVTPGRWSTSAPWSPVALPMLGVTAAGDIAPLVANFHTQRTIIDATGRTVEQGRVLQTQDGRYGIGFRTVDPHRTQRVARSCISCHGDPAALGLGSTRVDAPRLAWPLRYAPDQVADEEGTAIAAFSTPGERPLNYEELSRALRSAACAECHVDRPSPTGSRHALSPAEADRAHRHVLRTLAAQSQANRIPPPDGGTPAVPKMPAAPTGLPVETPVQAGATENVPTPDATLTRPPELSPFVGR